MNITLWQIEELARIARKHDRADDDTLATAHLTLRAVADEAVEMTTDAGLRVVVWHDGSDVTEDYR